MEIVEVLLLIKTLTERVVAALRDGRQSIEINDIGNRFAAVNERIQDDIPD